MTKNIIVTGASRGIGYETALYLSSLGHNVIAVARSVNGLEKLKEKSSALIHSIDADLTTDEGIQKIASFCSEYSQIDGLVNNAGKVHNQSFLETDISVFKDLMEVNVYSIVRLAQYLESKFKAGSHIVNIGSMGGFLGASKFPGLSAYSTAKGAVSTLTECLSAEFSARRVSVNCLCLGAVQTEMLAEAFPGYEAPVSADQMGKFIGNFVLEGHHFYNGKVLPVSLNNPD